MAHDHSGNHVHEHISYTTESLIAARTCLTCGGVVAAAKVDEHQIFHDRIALIESMLGITKDEHTGSDADAVSDAADEEPNATREIEAAPADEVAEVS